MPDISKQQSAQVIRFALQRSQEGNGECFTLVDNALRSLGVKSVADCAEVTPSADYKWGREITLGSARVGDILQFRNFSVTMRTDTSIARSSGGNETRWEERKQDRPHHTAIIRVLPQSGALTVLECNVNGSRNVQSNELHLRSVTLPARIATAADGTCTTIGVTITVRGAVKVYRPQTL